LAADGGQDSSTSADADPTTAGLIRLLDDDEPVVREKATVELIARGALIRSEVESALLKAEKERNAEVTDRCRYIIACLDQGPAREFLKEIKRRCPYYFYDEPEVVGDHFTAKYLPDVKIFRVPRIPIERAPYQKDLILLVPIQGGPVVEVKTWEDMRPYLKPVKNEEEAGQVSKLLAMFDSFQFMGYNGGLHDGHMVPSKMDNWFCAEMQTTSRISPSPRPCRIQFSTRGLPQGLVITQDWSRD